MDPTWGIDAERIAHLSQMQILIQHGTVSFRILRWNWQHLHQMLKDQGTAIFTWTIRSPEAEAVARQTVDNITFEGYLPRILEF